MSDDSETNDVKKMDELLMMMMMLLVWTLSRLAVCMEAVSVDMMSRFAVASLPVLIVTDSLDWVHVHGSCLKIVYCVDLCVAAKED